MRPRALTRSPHRLGHGSVWMFIPPRILVARDSVPDLEDGEHPTHVDPPEWACSTHHGDAVSRSAHVHHFSHPGLSHEHRTGDDAAYLLFEPGRLHRQQIRDAVAHLIHDVMRDVAVKRPITGMVGHELGVPGTPHGY